MKRENWIPPKRRNDVNTYIQLLDIFYYNGHLYLATIISDSRVQEQGRATKKRQRELTLV